MNNNTLARFRYDITHIADMKVAFKRGQRVLRNYRKNYLDDTYSDCWLSLNKARTLPKDLLDYCKHQDQNGLNINGREKYYTYAITMINDKSAIIYYFETIEELFRILANARHYSDFIRLEGESI